MNEVIADTTLQPMDHALLNDPVLPLQNSAADDYADGADSTGENEIQAVSFPDGVSAVESSMTETDTNETEIESPRTAKARDFQHVSNQIAADREKARSRRQATTHDKAPAFARILAAKNGQTVIRNARIIGAEELPITDDEGNVERRVPVACCMIYDIMAYIPLEELWLRLPPVLERLKDESAKQFFSYAKVRITNMAGSDNIPVVITEAVYRPDNPRQFAVLASRRMALLRDVAAFWRKPDDNNRPTAVTAENDEVTATVVSVQGVHVSLCVRGVEITVPYYMLTNRYLERASDMYRAGEELLVRIDKITWPEDSFHQAHLLANREELLSEMKAYPRGSSQYLRLHEQLAKDRIYQIPAITVSARDGEAIELFVNHGSEVRRGGRYRAIITYVFQNKDTMKPYVRMWLPDLQLPALSSRVVYGGVESSPVVGDMVEFSFSRVSPGSPILLGDITRKL